MATAINTVTIEQQFLTRLNNLGVAGNRIATASVNVVADMIVADAKRLAPKDLGTIAQNIGKVVSGEGDKVHASIYASAPESAFQEFGTGGRVIIPPGMQDVATQFKGASGGDFKAFVLALTAWVGRHGMDEKLAYVIARKILRDGLKPQPFLYPAYIANNYKLLPMLQTAYKTLTGSVNR